jgi:hypothetical protein
MRNYTRKVGRMHWKKKKYRYRIENGERVRVHKLSPGVVIRPERLIGRRWPARTTIYHSARILGISPSGLRRMLQRFAPELIYEDELKALAIARVDLFQFLKAQGKVTPQTWARVVAAYGKPIGEQKLNTE